RHVPPQETDAYLQRRMRLRRDGAVVRLIAVEFVRGRARACRRSREATERVERDGVDARDDGAELGRERLPRGGPYFVAEELARQRLAFGAADEEEFA